MSGPGEAATVLRDEPLGRGLIALGDSITNGEGQAALGITYRSWAQWLAAALELPYSNLAVNGARAPDVLTDQVPRMHGRYEIGCLYVGVNDARSPEFQVELYEPSLRETAKLVDAACDRLLMVTIPLDLGRPRAGDSVPQANAAIRRVAGRLPSVVVVETEPLRGFTRVLPDAVHLTAAGQVWLARRAAQALIAGGMQIANSPAEGAVPSRRAIARYALTGHAAAAARDARRRASEAIGRVDIRDRG